MHAAVLHALGAAPRYEAFPDPQPTAEESLIKVRAAAIKNIDRMLASGTHYATPPALPLVPGVDGVGLTEEGARVYFGAWHAPYGTMAERSLAVRDWTFPVPAALDDATAAALPNAALSSWLPLSERARLEPGETVLIQGATGSSGTLAIQVARALGAGRVVAAGRNRRVLERLPELGADATIPLDQPDDELIAHFAREARAAPFDVILDYLWGRPTELLLAALTGHELAGDERTHEGQRTRLVQIGEMAGASLVLPAAALRSSRLEIMGSGGGGISPQHIKEAIPSALALAAEGGLHMETEPLPLAEVTTAWQRGDRDGRRTVLIP